jgi:predicted nucleic acid-binding protein
LSRFVLDASVTLCWCFEDRASRYTEAMFERMATGDEACVPFVWPLEVANALLRAERKGTLRVAQLNGFLEELSAWPINVDTVGVGRAFHQILGVARQQNLSAYDASYLELAIREGLSLATTDEELRIAAQAAGIRIAGPN